MVLPPDTMNEKMAPAPKTGLLIKRGTIAQPSDWEFNMILLDRVSSLPIHGNKTTLRSCDKNAYN